jgi:hypothetical protein
MQYLYVPKRLQTSFRRIFFSIPLLLTTSSTVLAFSSLRAIHFPPQADKLGCASQKLNSFAANRLKPRGAFAPRMAALTLPLKVDPTSGTLESKIPLKVDASRLVNISSLPDSITPVVLVACGSFSPPTVLHTRIFETARDHFKTMRGEHGRPNHAFGLERMKLIAHYHAKSCYLIIIDHEDGFHPVQQISSRWTSLVASCAPCTRATARRASPLLRIE